MQENTKVPTHRVDKVISAGKNRAGMI